ncbi:tail sheath [Escherichia phage vB_EcoM_005]|uniref:Tail sheath protein n=1 Tax=Escherichia phage vB_EcoM_005 TaxID=2500761 RepID=A0A3Q9R9W7_9CAUD|nr:tail sheath [Escherichia phage vB_EcoM_005]AZV00948.1 tail sheath protein [Escherichia phage vB_EcoM_005]
MALLSPGIELKETSVQSTVVRNATGRAALVGKFQWGPAFQVTQITNEVELVDLFGGPNNEVADYFMSGMNFLQYGNDLRTVRVVNREFAKNASPIAGNVQTTITTAGSNYAVGDKINIKYNQTVIESEGRVTSVDTDGKILSVFIPTGKIISYARSVNQYPNLGPAWTAEVTSASSGVSGTITVGKIVTDSGILLTEAENSEEAITSLEFQASLKQFGMPGVVALYPGEIGSTLEVEIVSKAAYDAGSNKMLDIYPNGGTRASVAKAVFNYGPQTEDQYAIIVRRDGAIVESVVLSTKEGEKDVYGNNIYLDDYFAKGTSNYIFATSLNYGEGDEVASTVQKHVVSIADERQDCLAFISPPKGLLVNVPLTRAVDNLIDWRTGAALFDTNNMNISTTYAAIDGNYKYQYDKYNDVNRWVPLAADMAGLCARTDDVSQPWMSPAGYNRGQILNVLKLAIEPRQSQRDRMYQEAINPVVGFAGGDGFVLFGDKTATKVPSPMDHINVRRLFNMLKKNIGDASKYKLFELNDNFTRSSFRMEVSQYLDGIKALGGIYEGRVVCDTTVNTPAVIDRNEFIANIYVKPARSINYITLNFVATSTGADFDELIGPLV